MSVLEDMKKKGHSKVQCLKCYKMIPFQKLLLDYENAGKINLPRIKELIKSNKIDHAFDTLEEYISGSYNSFENEIILLKNSYLRVKKERLLGTINSDDYEKNQNIFISKLLKIVKDIENFGD